MKRILLVTASLIALLLVVALIVAPRIMSQEHISQKITHILKEKTGYVIEYDRVGLRFFPLPSLELRNLRLPDVQKEFSVRDSHDYVSVAVSIDRLNCRVRLFPLLMGKIELARISFKGLSCDGTIASIQNHQGYNGREMRDESRSVAVHVVGTEGMAVVEGSSRFSYSITIAMGDGRGKITSTGVVALSPDDATRVTFCDGTVTIDEGSLAYVTPLCNYFALPVVPEEGILRGGVAFSYDGDVVTALVDMSADAVVYHVWQENKIVKSTPLSGGVRGSITSVMSTAVLSFNNFWVDCQGSLMRVNGDLSYEPPYECDLSVYSEKTDLDALISSFPMIQNHIPLNVGFSGDVRYDVSVTYGEAGMSVQSNIELDETLLSYGTVFEKPKGMPMTVRVMCESEDRQVFVGDATLSINDMNLKMTVTHLDRVSQEVEASFISNSFGVAGWEQLFPTVPGQISDGQVKVFGAVKGNVLQLDAAQYSGGCVLQGIACDIFPGVRIEGITASMKMSKDYFESRAIRARLNGQLIEADVYAQLQPAVVYDVRISGSSLDLSFLDTYLGDTGASSAQSADGSSVTKKPAKKPAAMISEGAVSGDKITTPVMPQAPVLAGDVPLMPKKVQDRRVVLSFGSVTFLGNAMTDFSCVIKHAGKRFVVEDSAVMIAGGRVAATGHLGIETSMPFSPRDFSCMYSATGVAVEDVVYGNHPAVDMLEGTATLSGGFSGVFADMPQSLVGGGELVLTDGRLKKINFLDIISKVGRLLGAHFEQKGFTDFSRLEYDFNIKDSKISSDHMRLYSSLYDVEGIGAVGFDQSINYSFNVLLNERLSQKMMSSLAPGERMKIPVYIYNTLQAPKYSVEKSVTSAIINNVVNKGLEKLLGVRRGANSSPASSSSSSSRSKPLT